MRAALSTTLELLAGLFTCLAFIVAALMVFVGVVFLIVGFVDTPRLEHAQICRAGEHRGCLVARQGRVLSVGNTVLVQYNDGRSTVALHVRGHERPQERAFVRVEFWGSHAVAISDRQGHRYKDQDRWPAAWDHLALALVAIGSAVIAVPIAVVRLRALRRRISA